MADGFYEVPGLVIQPWGQGQLGYTDADGVFHPVEYPLGATLGQYTLVTSDDNVPVWRLTSAVIPQMLQEDGDFLIEDGEILEEGGP